MARTRRRLPRTLTAPAADFIMMQTETGNLSLAVLAKKRKIMSVLPNNPMMLLSYVNTQLRDEFESLDEFCRFFDVPKDEVEEKLKAIDYEYDAKLNRFV